MSSQGTVYILSAPSGAGKSSIMRAIFAVQDCLKPSISYTTRPMRPLEEQGRHYHFIDEHEFFAMVNSGQMLEYAKIYENYYGTSSRDIGQVLSQGYDILCDLDRFGMQQIKASRLFDVVSIFVLPPSVAELERRLNHRAQDSREVIAKRMSLARKEILYYNEYDYVVINADFDRAVQEVQAIIRATRAGKRKSHDIHELIPDF